MKILLFIILIIATFFIFNNFKSLALIKNIIPKEAYQTKYSIESREGAVEQQLEKVIDPDQVTVQDKKLPMISSAYKYDEQGNFKGIISIDLYSDRMQNSSDDAAQFMCQTLSALKDSKLKPRDEDVDFAVKIFSRAADSDIKVFGTLRMHHSEILKLNCYELKNASEFYTYVKAHGHIQLLK